MLNKKCLKKMLLYYNAHTCEEDFAYLYPCDELKISVSNFTISFPNSSIISDKYTIMPHGCVTLVLFQFKNELFSFLFGPTTKPIKVGNLANRCDMIFIIEFHPAGFFLFSKINQKELTDKIIPFSSINYAMDVAMKNIVEKALTLLDLLHEIEHVLLQNRRFHYPEILSFAIREIIKMEGSLSSLEISNNVHYSSRQCNRYFNLYLGMSMKSFSRLVRVNKVLRLLNEKENTIDFISEKLGYCDASHVVKDFKSVCRMTPQQYKLNMSIFYNEIAKF